MCWKIILLVSLGGGLDVCDIGFYCVGGVGG